MKIAIAALAAGLLISVSPALAQGASDNAPGHKMLDKGSKSGYPGASGYAPGQKMLRKGHKAGTRGASRYAPGHTTNGLGSTERDRDVNIKVKTK
jgi:hypothetical protein